MKKSKRESLLAQAMNEENRQPAYLKGLKVYKVPLAATVNLELITSPDLISKAIGEVTTHE
jgi:hypothetical protein